MARLSFALYLADDHPGLAIGPDFDREVRAPAGDRRNLGPHPAERYRRHQAQQLAQPGASLRLYGNSLRLRTHFQHPLKITLSVKNSRHFHLFQYFQRMLKITAR